MSLERMDLTQLVSFAPPPPRTAFALLDQGTTSTSETWGGSGTDGRTYSWFLIDTSWWVAASGSAADLNLLPVHTGIKLQVYSGKNGGSFIPELSLLNPPGAPDLLSMHDFLTTVTVEDATLRTVAGMRQGAADGSSWYIYFSPTTDTQFNPSTDGIVTWPEPRDPQWLGRMGHVAGQLMGWSKPGGPSTLQFNLLAPPDTRPAGLNCGRRIEAYRGAQCIWAGTLQEPQVSTAGWTVTADGTGTEGAAYAALYNTWDTDNPVDLAIGRGLRWRNDGIGSAPGLFGLSSSNAQDSGSLTVQDFLNLLTTSGSSYWSVEPPLSAGIPCKPWVLRIRPYPTDISGDPLAAGVKAAELWNVQEWQRTDLKAAMRRVPPDLYLVNSTPMSRTLNGTYNTLVCRYKSSPDIPATSASTAVAARYETVVIDQPSAVAAQGRTEYSLDMTSNDVMTEAQVIQVAQNILARYTRLSFSTAYTVQPGRLLNNGGEPVDLALDWSGKMVTILGENAPVGGDVSFRPLTFFIAEYVYDDDAQTATITPYQSAGKDIQSLIAEMFPNGFN